MICECILIGRNVPGGGRAFFDKLKCVEFCRYALYIMAATSISRRLYSVRGVVDLPTGKKKRRLCFSQSRRDRTGA